MAADIPEDGPRKPRTLAPCNGCGVCCVATPCAIALDYITAARPGETCPAIEWSGGRAWCGLVRRPLHHSDVLAADVGAISRAKVDAANYVLGRAVREALGDGECDSGDPLGIDWEEGITAAEYARNLAEWVG